MNEFVRVGSQVACTGDDAIAGTANCADLV
jgi:hypothetical protein